MILLHTPRLLLRPFQEDDWPAIHAYASDPEVVKHVEWGPNTLEETKFYLGETLKQQHKHQDFPFAVVLKNENILVGAAHLYVEHPEIREAWIGYVLNHEYWGLGIMTEAAHVLLQFGFDQLGLHRVTATCRPENIGSYRVLEKIGMTREGHLRQHKWMKGQWRDSYLYAILEDEWRDSST